MTPQKQIKTTLRGNGAMKAKIGVGVILFLAGVVAGVVGLCAALKLIFYIGLAVAILAAVALVWGIVAVRNRFADDNDYETGGR